MASILPSKNTTITSTPIAGTQISSSSKNTGTSSKSTSSTSKSAGGSSSKPVSSSTIYGTSSSGSKYTIGSEKGQNFVNSAASGSTMTGGDGSTWTKNSDGSTTIKTTSGQTFQVGGSTGGSSGGSSGGGSGYVQYTGGNAAMDAAIQPYKDAFNQAYQTGDVQAMINANNSANQIRNQYGYAAEFLNVAGLPGYSEYASGGGGGSAAGTVSTPQINLPTYENYVTDLSDYLNQMYAEQQKAALAAINSAYQQNVAALDKAQSEIAPQYQSARNQTAGTSEQAARNFAEYAAANGLGSGASAQADLARGIALQNNLNQLNESEANAYADLELQKSQAEIEYNNAIAQAQASNNAELAAALYQEKVRLQNALTDQQNTIFQQAVQAQQLQMQAQQNAIANQQWQQQFDTSNNQWQQQFDYNKYLNDIANQQWQQEFDTSNNQWQQQFDYNKYLNQVAQDQWQQEFDTSNSQWEQQFGFNKEQADIANNQWQQQFDTSNSQWQQEFDYQKYQDQLAQQNQDRQYLAAWGETMLKNGYMPPSEMLAAMGLTTDLANAYISFYRQYNAPVTTSYTGSSGRTTSGSSGRTTSGSSGTTGTSFNNLSSGNTGNNYKIDMNSVLQLGYGPITSDSLASLEAQGKIESYTDGNLIKFRKVQSSTPTTSTTTSSNKTSVLAPSLGLLGR